MLTQKKIFQIKDLGNRPDNWKINFQHNFPTFIILPSKYRNKRKMRGENMLHE